MGIAVVTGASSGLGVELALQLQHDADIDEIWLVARRRDKLGLVASRLEAAAGVVIACDLTVASEVSALAQRIREAGPKVRVLVNNAGGGVGGDVGNVPLDPLLETVDLNVRAVVHLTRVAIECMQPGGRIIQVSSSAALYPMPGLAVYTAAKAFVLHFTVSLAAELSSRKLLATVVCPGVMASEFWRVTSRGELEAPRLIAMKPSRAARIALRHARWGRWVSIPGWLWLLSALLSRVSPLRLSATVVRWFNPLRKLKSAS